MRLQIPGPVPTTMLTCRLRPFTAKRPTLLNCLRGGVAAAPIAHRRWSSDTPEISTIPPLEKPFYITTPIFYVNAAPHVGHLYTLILTDVLKKWHQLLGKNAIMATGTDEHGMKIQQAANAAEKLPKDFCDAASQTFKNLATEANISYDRFIRTTDTVHYDAVQYAWHMLNLNGYIYTSKHEGFYSVSDETFFPESATELRVDPETGHKDRYSIETGNIVEHTAETNYHFRLSAFQERLIKLYETENPNFVLPKARHDYILSHLNSKPLSDLSISRPRERLTWGIPVPHDSDQTIYVWLDALINYLTVAGYPFIPGLESANGWPADVHIIGKDILRFHCIYWPAFLMALDLPLPKNILTHAHWTMNKMKMSKSVGNVVSPSFALSRFGIDTMRYYLIHDGGLNDDSDYSNDMVVERYTKQLQGQLGNLLSRTTAERFKHKACVSHGAGRSWQEFPNTTVPGAAHSGQEDWKMQQEDLTQLNTLLKIPNEVFSLMKPDQYDVPGALKRIMDIIYRTNNYISHTEPWRLFSLMRSLKVKSERGGEPFNSEEFHRLEQEMTKTIFLTGEGLRVAGILLQPFIPGKAEELLSLLGVRQDRRGIDWLAVGCDAEYGASGEEHHKEKKKLFPPLESLE